MTGQTVVDKLWQARLLQTSYGRQIIMTKNRVFRLLKQVTYVFPISNT